MQSEELISNLNQLHTTPLGILRIQRNLSLDTEDVVTWCKGKITADKAIVTRNRKNWYVSVDDCVITINASSNTIITAHRKAK